MKKARGPEEGVAVGPSTNSISPAKAMERLGYILLPRMPHTNEEECDVVIHDDQRLGPRKLIRKSQVIKRGRGGEGEG